jgi:proteasome lid subunit RPN8/RPN11
MLKIPISLYREIVDHAREGLPLEVCGILAGLDGRISAVYRISNIDRSSEHFTMDPREHAEIMESLQARGLEMTAFYHSHPKGPQCPSAEDIRLAFYPDVFTVIASLEEPEGPFLSAFAIRDGLVEAVEIQIIRD